jgi:hypothetical protein
VTRVELGSMQIPFISIFLERQCIKPPFATKITAMHKIAILNKITTLTPDKEESGKEKVEGKRNGQRRINTKKQVEE